MGSFNFTSVVGWTPPPAYFEKRSPIVTETIFDITLKKNLRQMKTLQNLSRVFNRKALIITVNHLTSERVTADDVTVRPWPGGKYDLIQLHRQIRHQNARNLFFTTKLSLPPAIKIKILRKQ